MNITLNHIIINILAVEAVVINLALIVIVIKTLIEVQLGEVK